MTEVLLLVAGLVVGVVAVLAVLAIRRRDARALARALVDETENEKRENLERLLGGVKDSFGALSLEALERNAKDFLRLANEVLARQTQTGEKELEGKKALIDKTLESMRRDLRAIQDQVAGFEKDRALQHGQLSAQLKSAAEQTNRLQDTANHLRQALASTKTRGQWGERMAEDVLRLAGFVEGVNYLKQKALDAATSRPDYTFPLPQGLKVNMDVKFPLSNYLRYLETDSDADREAHKAQFLRDVRSRIKEVTTRDYINPEDKTVDYVLVFIPNEQVYAFINQNDPGLMDEALRNKVILCSPFTLFAMLAIIRQALDNFSMEKTAADMLRLIGAFNKEWEKFRDVMDKMGRKLEEAKAEYDKMTGVRRAKLEKPLRRIEDLRGLKGIEPEMALGEAEAVSLDQDEGPEEGK